LIVVDASALVDALVGPTPSAAARIAREPVLHGPHLLPLEVASALRKLVTERHLSERGGRQALDKLARLPLRLHPHVQLLPRIWELRSNLTVYDAVYAALAETLSLPLVTADARLSRAPRLRCIVEVV
jgi:predicted nucleic acid-binding protein